MLNVKAIVLDCFRTVVRNNSTLMSGDPGENSENLGITFVTIERFLVDLFSVECE